MTSVPVKPAKDYLPNLHEPFLARASEPESEDGGRNALGAFLTVRLVDRFTPEIEPPNPLALAYQVRATRDYLLELYPQTTEVTHLLEVVRMAEGVKNGAARSLVWPPMLAYAHWLEQELRLDEALDVVDTVLSLNDGRVRGEETSALLQRARILRLVGRLRDAREAYETARARAAAIGDTHSALLGRIGNAIVMRQSGNLNGSEDALREIVNDAQDQGDRDAMARAHHDLGGALALREKHREAVDHLFRAFELYEHAADRMRALSDVGEALKREQHYALAKEALTIVLRSSPTPQVKVHTRIALLELCALTGDRIGFTRLKRDIDAVSPELPPERLTDFHYLLGKGHAEFGDYKRAEISFRQAAVLAERHGFNEYSFRAEAALRELNTKKPTRDRPPMTAPESQVGYSENLTAIAQKLEMLRVS